MKPAARPATVPSEVLDEHDAAQEKPSDSVPPPAAAPEDAREVQYDQRQREKPEEPEGEKITHAPLPIC
jgi:hypothetical protein